MDFGKEYPSDTDSEVVMEPSETTLQEQLFDLMLENQHLVAELKKQTDESELHKLQWQLEREKEKSRILANKLQSRACSRKYIDLDRSNSFSQTETSSIPDIALSPRVRKRYRKTAKGGAALSKSKSLDHGEFVETVHQSDKKKLEDSVDSKGGGDESWYQRLWGSVHRHSISILDDFNEIADGAQESDNPDGEPLTVKKLKENVLRFNDISTPVCDTIDWIEDITRWKSPSASLIVFCVYVYCVYRDWLFSLCIALMLYRLTLNYMKQKGWAKLIVFKHLSSKVPSFKRDDERESGMTEKFALVLQVARRVQNKLGSICDAAEKINNLFYWEHESTKTLYRILWGVFLLSIIVPSHIIFTFIGVYLGLKVFLIDYVFYRFPKVKDRYDTTAKIWNSLPTNHDLKRNPGSQHKQFDNQIHGDNPGFQDLFNLPASEQPLPGWQGGKRCVQVNKDKSLTSAFKNGRLYLTSRLAACKFKDEPKDKHNRTNNNSNQNDIDPLFLNPNGFTSASSEEISILRDSPPPSGSYLENARNKRTRYWNSRFTSKSASFESNKSEKNNSTVERITDIISGKIMPL